MWRVYKSKVMKTLNPEYEEDMAEEVQKYNILLSSCVHQCFPCLQLFKLLALKSDMLQVLSLMIISYCIVRCTGLISKQRESAGRS